MYLLALPIQPSLNRSGIDTLDRERAFLNTPTFNFRTTMEAAILENLEDHAQAHVVSALCCLDKTEGRAEYT